MSLGRFMKLCALVGLIAIVGFVLWDKHQEKIDPREVVEAQVLSAPIAVGKDGFLYYPVFVQKYKRHLQISIGLVDRPYKDGDKMMVRVRLSKDGQIWPEEILQSSMSLRR
jgi:hypothetical protein